MHDFETIYNRSRNGSSKHVVMKREKPDVSEDIVPLSLADMEFHNADVIKERLCSYIEDNVLGYSRPVPDYLNSVVKFFKDFHGATINPEWIVTSPGVVPALATAVRTLTKEKEGVILFTPIYNPFYDVVVGQNRKLEEVPLIYENNRYKIDVEAFEQSAKKEDVKLILFCNPHNPGGTVWTKSEIETIGKIAKKHNVYIVSDEIHSDFIHRGRHVVLTELEDVRDISICCTAASKTFNIAGLQCSNVFIPNEAIRKRFIRANEVVGIERANVLGFVATQASYEKGLDWLLEAKKVIQTNLKIVEEFFTTLSDGFSVMPTDAGFLSWINFEGLGISKEEFYAVLYEADFFIIKGEVYGSAGKYFFRLNVGLPTRELKKALERLEKVFKKRVVEDKYSNDK